jgi:hypothetical protein
MSRGRNNLEDDPRRTIIYKEITPKNWCIVKDAITKVPAPKKDISVIKEERRQYYEANKQQRLEYQNIYNEKNKDKISERKKSFIDCKCGCKVRKGELSRHRKTEKHQRYVEAAAAAAQL